MERESIPGGLAARAAAAGRRSREWNGRVLMRRAEEWEEGVEPDLVAGRIGVKGVRHDGGGEITLGVEEACGEVVESTCGCRASLAMAVLMASLTWRLGSEAVFAAREDGEEDDAGIGGTASTSPRGAGRGW
jgi:hypothetical protein